MYIAYSCYQAPTAHTICLAVKGIDVRSSQSNGCSKFVYNVLTELQPQDSCDDRLVFSEAERRAGDSDNKIEP